MAGTGAYWAAAERQLLELAERLGIPVYLNGMGRGCVPADHRLAFSRTRGAGLGGCDLAVVIGVPLDFRLGFGGAIGAEAKLIRVDVEPNRLERNRAADFDLVGDVAATLGALTEAAAGAGGRPSGPTGGSPSCARPRTRSGPPSAPTSATTAPRCTRCGSTPSSPRCSTETRS